MLLNLQQFRYVLAHTASAIRIIIALGLFWIYVAQPPVSAAEVCVQGRSTAWSEDQAITYLELPRDVQSHPCTAAALQRLAVPDASPDPELLVDYLDFIRPGLSGMIVLRVANAADLYPAVKALVEIGADAVPVLLAYLKSPAVHRATRRNAARTIKLIYEDQPELGIMEIHRAAAAEPGIGKELLEEVATWLHAWCTDAEQDRCSMVYDAHRPGIEGQVR